MGAFTMEQLLQNKTKLEVFLFRSRKVTGFFKSFNNIFSQILVRSHNEVEFDYLDFNFFFFFFGNDNAASETRKDDSHEFLKLFCPVQFGKINFTKIA